MWCLRTSSLLSRTSSVFSSITRPVALAPIICQRSPHEGLQSRASHTDVVVPDFSAYRRTGGGQQSDVESRLINYGLILAGSVVAVYLVKNLLGSYLSTMNPSADVRALATTEVNLSMIPEGTGSTIIWRGKPVFVRHRTPEEVEGVRQVDISTLRDPQRDEDRVTKSDWLVVEATCTHLGCVPISHQGDFGGYFCPCHGSHYDASGRVRKGPAPLNLNVPEYTFTDDKSLLIGS
ncbi:ubiquinol-cytochrome c reductase iron-sulfur subunit-like [Corticium candelabrum]|uniref:ubiquinol-cytochrome c reductase iron-sulfur subunit-like n=1 Tax=Corticium candelabrum TaxID=121492 RepID=UPI002E26A6E3|nr:ubiquinol-cytochrome c reductase iron-sulfur subunit-like [Corticium candelabrum]